MADLNNDDLNDAIANLSITEFLNLKSVQEKIGEAREFTFNVVSEEAKNTEFSEAYLWDVSVVYRGPNSYAVENHGKQYTKDLHPGRESLPSSRTDRFKNSHRFPLEEALAIAKKLAPKVTLNGRTAKDYGYWVKAADLTKEHSANHPELDREARQDFFAETYEQLRNAN